MATDSVVISANSAAGNEAGAVLALGHLVGLPCLGLAVTSDGIAC